MRHESGDDEFLPPFTSKIPQARAGQGIRVRLSDKSLPWLRGKCGNDRTVLFPAIEKAIRRILVRNMDHPAVGSGCRNQQQGGARGGLPGADQWQRAGKIGVLVRGLSP